MPLDLVCYVQPHWRPRIRAAQPRREWMDATRESFAYRCLPLGIANAHGWEILGPCGFEATWNGGADATDIHIQADPGTAPDALPVSVFGHGVLTFHVNGLFRTPPGVNLWVGGAPNRAKDGIAPLGGVIETDWSPYTFTMNWRFTRPHQRVRFDENEPFCFFFPLPRDLLDGARARIAPIDEEPDLKRRFEEWSAARDRFQRDIATRAPAMPSERWQKFYFRGTDIDGTLGALDHRTKVRAPEFAGSEAFLPLNAGMQPKCPVSHAPPRDNAPSADALLAGLERLRTLSPQRRTIPCRRGIDAAEFLDQYYAGNWPLRLADEMAGWPALARWTTAHLTAMAGTWRLHAHDGSTGIPATLAEFVSRAEHPDGIGPRRLIADLAALPALAADLPGIDRLLSDRDPGRLWLEAPGSGVAAQPEVANRLLLQIVGWRKIWLAAPAETPRLQAVAGQGAPLDLSAPGMAERLAGLRVHELVLAPGDALFVPWGWWRQSAATVFSAAVERSDFVWPNPA